MRNSPDTSHGGLGESALPCRTLFLLALKLVLALAITGSAQGKIDVLESRKGAEAGAKPCKFEAWLRPCVLVTPERLALVREEILQGKGERRALYHKHVKANADRWLNRPITIPEVGGWAHDFFCSDGVRLELPENQIFDPRLPSKCSACGKTYLNDKIIAARHFHEHYWLAGAVRDLALAYSIERKGEYARKAAEILTKYADAYPSRLGQSHDGGFQSLSITEAVSLIPLAEGYDLIYETMNPDQRAHIEHDLFWPAAQWLSRCGLATRGNWGSWHLSAIGVIGYATRHQRFIALATEQFKLQIGQVLGDDGLWPESVHTYHFYPLDGFLAFTEAATNCGEDLYAWEAKPGKSIKAMFTAPLRYAFPNLRLAAINDGWYDAFLPDDRSTVAYYRYRLPEFAWAIKETQRGGRSGVPGNYFDQHYRNLLYGEPLPSQAQKPALASINFPILGIAVLRQGSDLPPNEEMMMTFDYGPFLGHGHPDKMGVTLFARGKLLAPDYGTSGYGAELTRFLQSTPAHNTIVIDGRNHKATRDRNLIAFKDTPEFKLAAARTSELIPGTSWTRTVMLADTYALVWDYVQSAEEHQYDWFFHAEGESLSLYGASADHSRTNPPGAEFSYRFITEVTQHALAGHSAVAQWISGADGLGLCLMTSPGQTAFTAKLPTPEAKHAPLLVLRQKSRRAEFLAVLRPSEGGSGPRWILSGSAGKTKAQCS